MRGVRKRQRGDPEMGVWDLAKWFAQEAIDHPDERSTMAVARILEVVSHLLLNSGVEYTDGRENLALRSLEQLADKVVNHLGATGVHKLAGDLFTAKEPSEAVHTAHKFVRTTLRGVTDEARQIDLIARGLTICLRSYFGQLKHAKAPDLGERIAKAVRKIKSSKPTLKLEPADSPRIVRRALRAAGMDRESATSRTKVLKDLWHEGRYLVPKVPPRK